MKPNDIRIAILANEGWPESGFKIHHDGFTYVFNNGAYSTRRTPIEPKPAFTKRHKKGRP